LERSGKGVAAAAAAALVTGNNGSRKNAGRAPLPSGWTIKPPRFSPCWYLGCV
jgi:hypothetical protein